MRIADYNCTIGELYGTARTGWQSYAEFLADFTAYRGFYDAAYGTTALAAIDAAEALPADQARYANSQVYRIELVIFADACLARWQTLKRYILTSFSPAIAAVRLEEAGSLRYLKAAHYNWDELRLMNVAATTFLTTFDTELSAGNNMPATFPIAYLADIALYNPKMDQFIASEEAGKVATRNKIDANNAVNATLKNMFKDGQEIFNNNPEVKDQFTFSTVLELYRGHGTAGIRGLATSSLDSQPISIFEVMILETSATAAGEHDGRYLLKPVASGTYTVRVTAPGYRTKVVHNVVISVGVVSTLDIELDPE